MLQSGRGNRIQKRSGSRNSKNPQIDDGVTHTVTLRPEGGWEDIICVKGEDCNPDEKHAWNSKKIILNDPDWRKKLKAEGRRARLEK